MQKFRILIHSMTFFRDFSPAYIVSQLLEHFGCDCFIASNENIYRKRVRMFNPHAIIFNTSSHAPRLAEAYPNALLFYCAGEGGQDYPNATEVMIMKREKSFKRMNRIYYWGQKDFSNSVQYVQSGESLFPIDLDLTAPDSKFRMVAHPRLDTVKFLPSPPPSKDGKIRVGFIGNCLFINRESKHHITRLFENPWKVELGIYAFELLGCYLSIMERLGTQNFAFNLRPYPIESRTPYRQSGLVKRGELTIDDHIDFASWVNEQDIVIGDVTEAFSTIFLAKKAFINIERLIPHYPKRHRSRSIAESSKLLQRNTPENYDELVAICNNLSDYNKYPDELRESLDYLYSIDERRSTMARIAVDVLSMLRNSKPKALSAGVDVRVVKLVNHLFHRGDSGSYSNFNFSKIIPKAMQELNPIVDNIIKSPLHAKLWESLS